MKNKDLKASLRRAVQKETPQILDRVLSDCTEKERANDMKDQNPKSFPWKKRWPLLAAAACLALAAGIVGITAIQRGGNAVDSMISLDVNPSIELTTNKQEKILEVRTLNEDAEQILDGMNLGGTDLKVAVNALIGSMVKHGYIDEARNAVLVSVENADPARGQAIQEELASSIQATLSQSNIAAAVLRQEIFDDAACKALADQYHISLGKAAFVQRLIQLDSTLTADQLCRLDIHDLSLLLLARQPDANGMLTGEVNDGQYIGLNRAKEIALERVPGAQVLELEFDIEDGVPCYEGEMQKDSIKYEFDIDAKTGEFLKWKEKTAHTGSASGSGSGIGVEQAKEIALNHAGIAAADASFIKEKLETEHGLTYYELEFLSGNAKYEYDVDASSGEVLKYERSVTGGGQSALPSNPSAPASSVPAPSAPGASSQPQTQIGSERAKQIAFSHAGVSASSTTVTKLKLDYDHGVPLYEVEFISGNVKYEYEIHALTGEILQAEREEKAASRPPSSASSLISEQRAKEIALARAGGGTIVEFKLDNDERPKYEGKIINNGVEYEFEIDAVTGQILEWEIDD